jgi:hypothetical protein
MMVGVFQPNLKKVTKKNKPQNGKVEKRSKQPYIQGKSLHHPLNYEGWNTSPPELQNWVFYPLN